MAIGSGRNPQANFPEQLRHFQELGDVRGEASVLEKAVQFHLADQDDEEAESLARGFEERCRKSGDTWGEAFALTTLAQIYMSKKEAEPALQAAEAAMRLYNASADMQGEAQAWVAVAKAQAQKVGDLLRSTVESEKDEGLELTSADVAERLQMEVDVATSSVKQAVACCQAVGDSAGEAAALQTASQVHVWRQEHFEALRAAKRSRTLFKRLGDELGEAHALLLEATANVNLDSRDAARRSAQQAMRIFRQSDEPGAKDGKDEALELLETIREMPGEGAPFSDGMIHSVAFSQWLAE